MPVNGMEQESEGKKDMKEGVNLFAGRLKVPWSGAPIHEVRQVMKMVEAGWICGRPEIREEGELERQASAALSGKLIPKASASTLLISHHQSDETFG